MFKSARWRSEKNKIKAVFKLQFHATQVSQVGGDALTVSVVPADVGKPTIRLEKAKIQDGSCYWKNPVYETVKFVQEPKSGKIQERIYHFVIGTGASRAGVVGEASIDFSSYALATKISSVSLPLKNSKSEIFLHVSIQRMPESFDQREVEEIENVKLNSQDRSLRAQLSNGEIDGSIKTNSIEDAPLNKSINPNVEINGKRRTSSGSDITMSSSDSSLGLDTPQEIQVKTDNIHQEPNSFFPSSNHGSLLQRPTSDASGAAYKERQKSWEWLGGMALEASTDDSSGTPRETLVRVVSEEAPDTVVEKLKYELTALSRQAEMSELELQTLRKQIVKESKRGQDLSREIINLKEERDIFKEECEKLKAFRSRLDETKARNKLQFEGGDPQALVEELRQELSYHKDLNNNLRIQLQKTQESNSELILAVRDLDEMLEQKNKEIADVVDKSGRFGSVESIQELRYKCETDDDDDAEQKALEELVKDHTNAKEAYLLEQKVMDLQSEIDIYRRERDELEMQMEQLALDYEILKQENHDMSYKLEQSQLQEQLKMQYECSSSYATVNELEAQIENLEKELNKRSQEFSDSLGTISEHETQIKSLEDELKHQSREYSESLITIKELEAQVRNLENELTNHSRENSDSLITVKQLEDHIRALEEELENQAHGFETDLEALTRAKVEQERRAIQAEETLRKMRWQNASTAERLQEEFKKLSMQMASTFEANESLATKALAEANELRMQKTRLEEKLQKASESLQMVRERYEARLNELSGQVVSMSNQVENLQSEVKDKSVLFEHQLEHAEETQTQLAQEITMLKTEIEALVTENKSLSEIAEERAALTSELVELRKSFLELESLFNQGNNEKAELENRIILVKEKAEESLRGLHTMTCLKDEKELMAKNLQLEVEALKAYCNELKNTLSEDELEKEKLKKQVLQLKGDLKRKEDAFSSMEKKLKDSNGRVTGSDGAKATPKNNKLQPSPRGNKEVANLKEKIKLLEGQIKLKETALEKSTNSFLEKENDLQNKIEELEQILHTLSHNTINLCKEKYDKATEVSEDLMLNGGSVEVMDVAENLSTTACTSGDEKSEPSCIRSVDDSSEKESTSFASDSRKFEELQSEITLLKDKNKLMEDELKEMQERYSEISLKFAEVEGERQQLVMRLRNLKNAKKNHA